MLAKLYVKWWLFKNDRSGVTAIEYGVIAAAVVVLIVSIVYAVGGQLKTTFTEVKEALENKGATP